MVRGEQVLRQWNLLRTLQTRGEGIPLRQLADDFEVSERTIQRDFELLQAIGFPVQHEEDDFGKRYWRMPHDFFRTGPLVLGLTEAVSLHLAEHFFAPLAGTHFADGLRSALEKIRSIIPAKALAYFGDLDETLYVRMSAVTDYAAHADKIRLLTEAAHLSRSVELTYSAIWRGDSYTTRCDPYGIVCYDGDLFLVGHSHRAEDVRIFKVPRILAVAASPETFERPKDFRLDDRFRSSFGIFQPSGAPVEVAVAFRGPVASLVEERVWHESQRLQWIPGEETLFERAPESEVLLATFRLGDLVEFKRWLKGWGDLAEVLRPDWLRKEMRAELTAAADRYA